MACAEIDRAHTVVFHRVRTVQVVDQIADDDALLCNVEKHVALVLFRDMALCQFKVRAWDRRDAGSCDCGACHD